jgi:hypothetical protein
MITKNMHLWWNYYLAFPTMLDFNYVGANILFDI